MWIGVRAAIALSEALPRGQLPEVPRGLPLHAVVGLAAVVALLGLIDVARRNERLLLANLGIRQHVVAALSALAAFAAEVVVVVLRGQGS